MMCAWCDLMGACMCVLYLRSFVGCVFFELPPVLTSQWCVYLAPARDALKRTTQKRRHTPHQVMTFQYFRGAWTVVCCIYCLCACLCAIQFVEFIAMRQELFSRFLEPCEGKSGSILLSLSGPSGGLGINTLNMQHSHVFLNHGGTVWTWYWSVCNPHRCQDLQATFRGKLMDFHLQNPGG